MYVVIVGAGRVGFSLARWLLAAEHEVALVERRSARCVALENELGSISVEGDGTEASILARAGANRADVFIAATGRDDSNLVACQLAKHRFGASFTVSLLTIPEHESLFNLLGIDVTINTSELIAGSIKERLSGFELQERGI